jgi:hypothetical protein
MQFVGWMSMFWKNLLPPFFKNAAEGSSEKSVPIYQITWCHVPEGCCVDAVERILNLTLSI